MKRFRSLSPARRVLSAALCALLLCGCQAPAVPDASPCPSEEVICAPSAFPALSPAPAPEPTPRITPDSQDALPTVSPALHGTPGSLSQPAEQRYFRSEEETSVLCPHGSGSTVCQVCFSEGALPLPDIIRLSQILTRITAAPRPLGSAQEKETAGLIERELNALGFSVSRQAVTPQTVGFGRPGTNELTYALGKMKLSAVEGSAEGQATGTVLCYDPDEPLPASVEGQILILEKSTSFLSLIRGMNLGVPAGIVLRDVTDSAAQAVAQQWPEQIVALYEEGDLPRSGDEVTLTSVGNGEYESENLIAVYGEGKGNSLYFCAHYDSAVLSPGACDNGAGVAVLLELARLTAAVKPEREVRFLFFTGEEDGLFGSSVYAKSMSGEEKAAVKGLYNLDMFADAAQGTPLLYTCDGEANDASAFLYSALFARNLDMPVFGKEDRSDHAVFAALGIPSAMFAQSESDELYHTPYDTMDRLSVSHMDQVALWCMAVICAPAQ